MRCTNLPGIVVGCTPRSKNYQKAFDLLRDGSYAESADAFNQFLAAFSASPLAGNAQYWLAETYYVQQEFSAALPVFQLVYFIFEKLRLSIPEGKGPRCVQ